jgi:hypothetical protein
MEGAPDAVAAAPAEARDADEVDIIQKETQNQNIDTQDVLGETPVQKEAQEEHQGINTQEQSISEAAPEQSVPSTEAQWSVDQDELLNPYEDEEGSIPKDQLLNPYEDEPIPISKDELLNPYEDDPVVGP